MPLVTNILINGRRISVRGTLNHLHGEVVPFYSFPAGLTHLVAMMQATTQPGSACHSFGESDSHLNLTVETYLTVSCNYSVKFLVCTRLHPYRVTMVPVSSWLALRRSWSPDPPITARLILLYGIRSSHISRSEFRNDFRLRKIPVQMDNGTAAARDASDVYVRFHNLAAGNIVSTAAE